MPPNAANADFPLVISSLLTTPRQIAGDVEIVSGGLTRYRYRDLDDRLRRLAGGLGALGVGKGGVVAVMDWDTHRYFEAFFAVPMLGAVLHTVNIRLAPAQIAYTIDHARDDVIMVHRDFLPLLEEVMTLVKRKVKLVLLGEGDDDRDGGKDADKDGGAKAVRGAQRGAQTGAQKDAGEKGALRFADSYDAIMARDAGDFTFPAFDENTRATTFYTTGTTGEPKGVAFTHRQIVLHTLGILSGFGTIETDNRLHRGDVYMPITPMFHVHAWGVPYAATLLGIKQVYAGRYTPQTLLQLIEDEGVTFTHCVPTILHMLLEERKRAGTDLGRLKMLVGGSALPEGLAKAAMAQGIDVYTGYGLSETCPVLTAAMIAPGDDAQIDVRIKTGKPLPMVELEVVDEDMNPLPRDGKSAGEVVVRAPWLNAEYVGDAQATRALWRGGYLHTGDVGHIEPDGTLQITDRMKDVIKSGGEWVSSLALESLASSVDGVAEVAAIGVADKKWGERPVLLVVAASDVGDTGQAGAAAAKTAKTAKAVKAIEPIEAIRAAILKTVTAEIEAGNLSKWAKPDVIHFVESIAKTSVGKIDKKRLRAEFG